MSQTQTVKELVTKVGGYSIAGRKSCNQDAFAAHTPKGADLLYKGVAAAVSDGVSSCDVSHIASQTSVTSFIADYYSTSQSWSVKHSASRVLTGLNAWIAQQNTGRSRSDVLCTFSAVVVKSRTVSWFHVGDSRIYHLHRRVEQPDHFQCLTTDHVHQEGKQHYLSRALGSAASIDVDYSEIEVCEKDLLLLITDGVHSVLTDKQIMAVLDDYTQPEETAKALIKAAFEAGSEDNLTALIIEIESLPEANLEESHYHLTALPVPPALVVGNKIDDYLVEEIIYSGTRSHVYRVVDPSNGQKYVLKAPSENVIDDLVYMDGFIREEWVGQHLKHMNVMKTYPTPKKNWRYYLSEWIDGISLRQWMDDHPEPDLSVVRPLVSQMITGLRAFQRADMVHQDVKPENIMLEKGGRVVIIDFGTVRIAGIDEVASPLDQSVPAGAVGYVAPEYLMGEGGNSRSDLFSLAVVIYEMLIGKLPYEAPKQPRIKSYSDLVYRSGLSHGRRLPVWVDACLAKALKANPNERYHAFSELEKDLSEPNKSLVLAHEKVPLIARNPIKVWQGVTFVLVIIVLIQQYWIHTQ